MNKADAINAIPRDVQGASLPFKRAMKALAVAWHRKHGHNTPVPEVSYALSGLSRGDWSLVCAETLEPLAMVDHEARCILIEDMPETPAEEPLSVDLKAVEATPEEADPTIPMHRYPAGNKAFHPRENKAAVTIKKRRVFTRPGEPS